MALLFSHYTKLLSLSEVLQDGWSGQAPERAEKKSEEGKEGVVSGVALLRKCVWSLLANLMSHVSTCSPSIPIMLNCFNQQKEPHSMSQCEHSEFLVCMYVCVQKLSEKPGSGSS